MSEPVKAWCVKSPPRGKFPGGLVTWTCFRPGPEYAVAEYYRIEDLEKAKFQMDCLVRDGTIDVVEVEVRETGVRYDPDQPGLYKTDGEQG